VNGVTPVALSTDSFYVDRVDTPLDDEGHYDFESIDAIDLPLFNQTLTKLLAGEQVLTPRYDFPRGRRKPRDDWRPLQLLPGQVLLIEGIHGLNPRLTERLPDTVKFRIYINALTQLCIDEHNRIFTSDTRLLRRIVRDRLFRGYSAQETIANWPRVRRGEMRWIYPFQEAADVMFNSSLVYEHAVLRLYAERFLLEVPEDDEAFVNAHRLLRFVEYFVPMFDESTPETSIIREFVGGSFFNY
jgi:uridine kinase